MPVIRNQYIVFMIKKFIFTLMAGLCWGRAVSAAVNIAVIAPKSGDYSVTAADLAAGVRAAVAEINAQGGLLGQSVNLIEVDDQCDDRFNISMAQMMAVNSSAEDKMSLVIGPYCANQFAEVAGIYAKGKILQIMPLPADDEKLTVPYAGLLRLTGRRSAQADKFFEYYKMKFMNWNVAVVYDGDIRSAVEIAAVLQQKFADAGMSGRLVSYNFAHYGNDYARLARDILQIGQVVYILGESEETARLTHEIGDMKNGTPVFTDRYNLREDYADIVDAGQKELYFLGLDSLKDNPRFAPTLVRLRLHGLEPRGLGVYGYLSVSLWKSLVLKAETFDYDKVVATAGSGKIGLPWGNISFASGTSASPAPYGIYGFRGKEYTQVY